MRRTPAIVLCAPLLACAADSQPLGDVAQPAQVVASVGPPAAKEVLAPPPGPGGASAAASSPAAGFANDPRWHSLLLKIAGRYEIWGRVDDASRWAPYDCKMPPPPKAQFSASGDDVTHGHKLYTLYALDAAAYGASASVLSDDRTTFPELTQSVVKEAFVPEPAAVPTSVLGRLERDSPRHGKRSRGKDRP